MVLALPHEVRATRTPGSPPDCLRPGVVGWSQPTAGEALRFTRRLVEDDLWSAKTSILPICGSPPRISLYGVKLSASVEEGTPPVRRDIEPLVHLCRPGVALWVDILRVLGCRLRSRTPLAAENLFLRKQLALCRKRHVNPRRASER